ncbi:MAG: ATP-binding protein [Myxococcales bacterium]|nr:ATP-binding protein [Myxococcales bacterium]
MPARTLSIGRARALDAAPETAAPLELPPHHLVTHGVVVGMTGSGKTGLAMVLVEEALRSKVPILMVDIKGDLPNLLLTFPGLDGPSFAPWVDPETAARDGTTVDANAVAIADTWRNGLAKWSLTGDDVRALREGIAPRILTPGATFGEPVHVLSALEQPSDLWSVDEETARESLSAAVSLLLRLLDREADPTRSREHVVLCQFAEHRLRAGKGATLEALLEDLARPPFARVGAMAIDEFLPPKERQSLSQDLNTLLASPSFATWRRGTSLDVGRWLARPKDGRTPAVIVSVAHLDDNERALVLGLLFDAILGWVRGLSGTSELRALIVFDEVYGFIPPHPANPPTKKPLLSLMKQARAFGVGVLLATQNPMDLDYKALSNAGVWFVGRLQTDADRERVVEGLAGTDGGTGGLTSSELASALKSLPKRVFFVRNVHRTPQCSLVESRWCLSWLRGPMTRVEMKKLAAPLIESSKNTANTSTNSDLVPPITPTRSEVVPPPGPAITPAQSDVVPPPSPAIPPTRLDIPVSAIPPTGSIDTSARPAPSEVMPEGLVASVPIAPEGWKTWHGHADSAPVSRWKYVPYVAVKAVGHMRDAKVGLDQRVTAIIAAPLLEDGRADITRAVTVDPKFIANTPAPGARYLALPIAVTKAATRKNAERAMKDHAARTFTIERLVHEELSLVQTEGESREAFAQRCREAALRHAAAERASVEAKHAPKIQRLAEKAQTARSLYAAAEAAVRAAPGGAELLATGLFLGKSAVKSATTKRDKAADKLIKAKSAVEDADSAWREAVNVRDQAVSALAREAERAGEGITSKVVTPKKGDVEVIEIGIAWARG